MGRLGLVVVGLLTLSTVAVLANDDAALRLGAVQELHQARVNPREAFQGWVQKFERAYKDNVEEFDTRFNIWLDNLEYIIQYNAKHTSHWLGLTRFADWTREEYLQHALGYLPQLKNDTLLGSRPTTFRYADVEVPKSIDWREKNAVTQVKNQMQCGSCWAFSTTGAVEGINAIVTGEKITLSEQELVDCDTTRDHGCHGGLMDFAFKFIMRNGGLDTEKDYPYKAEEGTCKVEKRDRHVVTIDGFEDVPANDEKALMKAVANQPVAVAIEADQREFQLYSGGVFDGECGTALDHGVLVVGYGEEKGAPYWIVKNSWGAEWGDKGFIKLKRGMGLQGQCGIAMQASYPTKEGPNPPPAPPGPPEPPTPPEPKPVDCDQTTQCPAGSTCCCMREYFGFCFTWACCPLPKATCCEDLTHCCPHTLPVCDTTAGRCLAKEGAGFLGSVEWSTKTAATKAHKGRTWHLPHLPTWAHPQPSAVSAIAGILAGDGAPAAAVSAADGQQEEGQGQQPMSMS